MLILLSINFAMLIKCSINIHALNFQYFAPNFGTCPDNLDTYIVKKKTLHVTTSFTCTYFFQFIDEGETIFQGNYCCIVFVRTSFTDYELEISIMYI